MSHTRYAAFPAKEHAARTRLNPPAPASGHGLGREVMERPVTISAANTFDRASTIYLYAGGDSWHGHLTQQNALVESQAPDA